jgi:hypothetical protein
MFEPQSPFVFGLLVVAFGALIWWLVRTRLLALRVLAAVLAFVPPLAFGVLSVNKYYDYYPTWGSAIDDLTGQAGTPASGAQLTLASIDANQQALTRAQHQGYTLTLELTGQRSHITRRVLVFLPPQYFQQADSSYRFPVIELIHGSPGEPQDWVNVAGGTAALVSLVSKGLAKPAVFVIPDANGSRYDDLQCLNQVGGPQDLTYLAVDLPDEIASLLRVQPPGAAWGIAGYSSGGYCAINMGVQFRARYGFAGVLSGYFDPTDNQFGNKNVDPFGGNYQLRLQNNPLDQIETLPKGTVIPQFWLGAGLGNTGDVQNAELMLQGIKILQPHVTLTLTSGAGHTMATWRSEIPPLLEWMTRGVAAAAANQQE